MRIYFAFRILLILLAAYCVPTYCTPVSPLQCANPGSTSATLNDNSVHANSCTDFSYLFPNNNNAAMVPKNNWLYGYYAYNSGLLNLSNQTPSFSPLTQQVADPNNPGHFLGFWALNFNQYWTSLDAFGGHSNSTVTNLHAAPFCDQANLQNCGNGADTRSPNSPDSANQFAVRRYEIPLTFNGTVTITVQVQKDYRAVGAGVSPNADGDFNYVLQYHNGQPVLLTPDGGQSSVLQTPTPVSSLQVQNPGPNTFPIQTVTFTNVTVHGGDFIDFVVAPGANDYSDGEFELITLTGAVQITPEPISLLLAGSGLLLFGLLSRRKYFKPSKAIAS